MSDTRRGPGRRDAAEVEKESGNDEGWLVENWLLATGQSYVLHYDNRTVFLRT